MKVLLIGGCGFIGSHVADSLVAAGMTVRIFDRAPERFRAPLPGVEYVQGDLNNLAQVHDALRQMDAVIHLASTTVPATANSDPAADVQGNLISMIRLLEAMRAIGLRRMVYLSSGGTVYGPPDTPLVDEDHPLRPINSYGIVKVAIESYLHMEHRLHGLRRVIMRVSNPYGPRQGNTGIQGIIGTHMWRMARNEPVEVWGDGSIVRDYVHVRDIAEFCLRALQHDATGVYNVGSGKGISVAEIIAATRAVAGRSGHKIAPPIYKPGRSFDVPRVVLDIGRAGRELGWQPRISLTDGLNETWDWIQTFHPPCPSDQADGEPVRA